jgi:tetratricopeptide (TPR) repeat protein
MKKTFLPFLLTVLLLCFVPSAVLAQGPPALQQGIEQYKADNYEEALETFKKVRAENPASSEAAFWLGLTYKQMNNAAEALPNLEAATTLKPPVKEAVIELIDVLYQMGRIEEAKKWIAVAEQNNIYPAKTAFLKGMTLAKEGKHGEAVESFERSKKLDASYTSAADFQIGVSLMMERKFDKAQARFQAAITQDPLSDLAAYARRYSDIVEQRSFLERPLRFTVGVMGQYDTNFIQEPNAYVGVPQPLPGQIDIGKEYGYALATSARMDWVPALKGPWLFNAGVAVTSTLHERFIIAQNGNVPSTNYDMFATSIYVAPGYDFGRAALNLSASYTSTLKRNPSYERYTDFYNIGPLFRVSLTEAHNQLLEFYAGYAKKDYTNKFNTQVWPYQDLINRDEEDQTGEGFNAYVSWFWLFRNTGLLNLKYTYTKDHARGVNWDNEGHRFTANVIYPVWRALKLQLSGDAYLQDYDRPNTFAVFNGETRKDRTYTGTAGLTWEFNRYLSALVQYTHIRAHSNLFLYDYTREIYAAGFELRF